MANITITNNDLGSVILESGEFRDETLTFADADTYAAGTILARQVVATAVTVAADESNTGDGTVTVASVAAGPVVPVVGAYVLTVLSAITNGGVIKLVDPNGSIVLPSFTLTAGAGAATVIEAGGLVFTVTDGDTDFAAGDFFTITVAAGGTMVPFVSTGAGGAQTPKAVLTYDVTVTAAGTKAARVMVSGSVKKHRLIIDADGDDTNVNAAVIDQLRDYGIIVVNTTELGNLDTQD